MLIFYSIKKCNGKISAKIELLLILAEIFVDIAGIIKYNGNEQNYTQPRCIMAYINRHIEQRITELSKTWSAILLTGPRQSGKTTMLKNLAEKENIGREYISLDDLTMNKMLL